jgi:hypothetical protein
MDGVEGGGSLVVNRIKGGTSTWLVVVGVGAVFCHWEQNSFLFVIWCSSTLRTQSNALVEPVT